MNETEVQPLLAESEEEMNQTKPRRRKGSVQSGDDSNVDSETDQTPAVQKPKQTKFQKFKTRFILTWSMIGAFGLIIYLGHLALSLLVMVLQCMGFHEIASLGTIPRKEKELPGFYIFHWHIFISALFFMYGHILMDHLLLVGIVQNVSYVRPLFEFIIRYHELITFTLVITGLLYFVMSLKKGFNRYQFTQLAWCLVTTIILVGLSSFTIVNILDGLIWYIVPALLIITNDVMAYMSGITFGKTPIIALSPNKTLEGFVGGAIFTFMFAAGLSSIFIDYQWFTCPKIVECFIYTLFPFLL